MVFFLYYLLLIELWPNNHEGHWEFNFVPETFLSDWTGCAMGYEQRLVHSPPNAEVYTLGTDFLETEITFGHSFFKCT